MNQNGRLKARLIQEAERHIDGLNGRIRQAEEELAAMTADRNEARGVLQLLKGRPQEAITEAVTRPRTNPSEYLEAAKVLTEEHGRFTTAQLADLMGHGSDTQRARSRCSRNDALERIGIGVYRAR